MSRATPNLDDDFDGIKMPIVGPRRMGMDGDKPAFVSYMNQITSALASLHDDGSGVRPDYLPKGGLWADTQADGGIRVYQYNGAADVLIWAVDKNGRTSIASATVLPGMVFPFSGTLGGANNKFPLDRNTGLPDLSYALCDGATYTAPDGTMVTTPDLRDRFIVGAGGTYAPADTGGSAKHKHTVTAANTTAVNQNATAVNGATTLALTQIPAHAHNIQGWSQGGATNGMTAWEAREKGNVYITEKAGGGGSHTHTQSAHTHTQSAHSHTLTVADSDNCPPYYALSYIMKL